MSEHIAISFKIPKRSLWSLLIFVGVGLFAFAQAVGYLIPDFVEIYNLEPETTTINDIGFMWVPIITYLLVSVLVCSLVSICRKLKPYKDGLIVWLVFGLIVGLIVGSIVVVVMSLVFLLVVWLAIGLVFGLVFGLIEEFK